MFKKLLPASFELYLFGLHYFFIIRLVVAITEECNHLTIIGIKDGGSGW